MTKPVVAHLLKQYLPPTQTFIYYPLKNFSRVDPIVLAGEISNLDKFYLPQVYALSSLNILPGKIDNWFFSNFSKRPFKKPYQWRMLVKHRAELIHAHFGWGGLQAIFFKRLTKLPLIVTFYGRDISHAALPGFAHKYKKMFELADRILVEGPHMRQQIIHVGCPVEKVHLFRISIDLTMFNFKIRTFPGSHQPIKILMCGRFVEKKGFVPGLKAFAQALKRVNQPLQLDIVGDGELRPQIEQTINSLNVQPWVKLWGNLSYKEYINLADQAHIFMAPSQTASDGDTEGGAPTVLLEMQALGLPIISTCHADIPYVVQPEHNEFLSPEFDVEALAENLVRLVTLPERWPTIGQRGRVFVERWHDLAVNVPLLEDIYFELIAAKSKYRS